MNIGKIIYGFCNGFFGHDDCDDKIIIAEGYNWIVCKYMNSEDKDSVTFASFKNEKEKQEYIDKWSKWER